MDETMIRDELTTLGFPDWWTGLKGGMLVAMILILIVGNWGRGGHG